MFGLSYNYYSSAFNGIMKINFKNSMKIDVYPKILIKLNQPFKIFYIGPKENLVDWKKITISYLVKHRTNNFL